MQPHAPESRSTRRIVIVDDDDAVRQSIRFSLETEGYSVRAYSGARELFADASFPPCDCLIVDQMMPDVTGLELIEQLRRRGVQIPVILITGYASQALRERAAARGVAVVEKPIAGPDLVDQVRGAGRV
jgi:FixJ family two-component response regulator